LAGSDLQATDPLAVADLSAAETKKITAKELIQSGLALVDAGSLPANTIDWSRVGGGTVSGLAIADRSLPAVKLVLDSITAQEIAPGAIGGSELASGAVDTAALADLAVTGAKIADDTITAAQIQPKAVGTSELADGAVDSTVLRDGAVTASKLAAGSVGTPALGDGAVTADKIADDSIGALQIAPNSITASELADSSVDTPAIIDGSVTSAKLASGIDGAKLTADTVTADKIPAASLDRGLNKDTGAIGHSNAVTAGTSSGITFDAQGHITGATALVPSDLPLATTTTTGVVSVLASSGLTVSGVGALGHTNAVTTGTRNGITFDAQGHVTATAALVSGDLPVATSTALGGISVSGPALSVSGTGQLSHATSGVAAGTYTKLTVDEKGHVTTGTLLNAADVPALDASKITTGTLAAARIADKSITRQMLADYSIAYIQEVTPPVAGQHAGTLWLQESTGQLRMFNANSWFPVGFGRLSAENLRYCGIFDAATGQIAGLTQFGTTEGFKIGDTLPTATDARSGVYFVCTTPGSGTTVTPAITYDNGDWILCNGVTAGWLRVDTLNSGGGGGGGASSLDDLLDVELTAETAGDQLVLGSAGQWVNKAPSIASTTVAGLVQLADSAAVTAGTAGLAVDAAELKTHYAPLADAALTGVPTAPTATAGTSTTQLATTAFVAAAVTSGIGSVPNATTSTYGTVRLADSAAVAAGTADRVVEAAQLKTHYAPLANAALTGTPTAPTAAAGTATTQLATTAFVKAATPDASTTVKGIIQLATAAEVLAGTALVKAVTPKEAKDHYLAKNIALLAALP
jgi:hypothetical protein